MVVGEGHLKPEMPQGKNWGLPVRVGGGLQDDGRKLEPASGWETRPALLEVRLARCAQCELPSPPQPLDTLRASLMGSIPVPPSTTPSVSAFSLSWHSHPPGPPSQELGPPPRLLSYPTSYPSPCSITFTL